MSVIGLPRKDSRSSEDSQVSGDRPSGKIMISVHDKLGVQHRMVTPIPKSYQDAVKIASANLGVHLRSFEDETDVTDLCLDDLRLEYLMKPNYGDAVWAAISPEVWTKVVSDGDHLQLFRKPSCGDTGRIGKPILCFFTLNHGDLVIHRVALLPNTLLATKRLAQTLYKRWLHGEELRDIDFEIKGEFEGKQEWFEVVDAAATRWMDLIQAINEKYSHVDIQIAGNLDW